MYPARISYMQICKFPRREVQNHPQGLFQPQTLDSQTVNLDWYATQVMRQKKQSPHLHQKSVILSFAWRPAEIASVISGMSDMSVTSSCLSCWVCLPCLLCLSLPSMPIMPIMSIMLRMSIMFIYAGSCLQVSFSLTWISMRGFNENLHTRR